MQSLVTGLSTWAESMNNQPAFIVGHHHPREPTVILMFPPARTASLETTWKLNPNANTLWETCCLGSLQWECTCGKTPVFAVAAELSPGVHLQCWCYSELVRSCVETGGAAWRFLRQDYSAARSANQTHSVGYVLECTLCLIYFGFST